MKKSVYAVKLVQKYNNNNNAKRRPFFCTKNVYNFCPITFESHHIMSTEIASSKINRFSEKHILLLNQQLSLNKKLWWYYRPGLLELYVRTETGT